MYRKKIKKKTREDIENFISEKINSVDVQYSNLSSYTLTTHCCDYNRDLLPEPDEEDWDEDEEYEARINIVEALIISDGIYEYVDVPEGKEDLAQEIALEIIDLRRVNA